jgi:rsbT co-antagonist protein RsbR
MTAEAGMSKLPEIIRRHEDQIWSTWLKEVGNAVRRTDLMSDRDFQSQGRELLASIAEGAESGDVVQLDSSAWSHARELLASISANRATLGFKPSETATFVLSLKLPLFQSIRKELAGSPDAMFDELWNATVMIDKFALITSDAFLATREQLIIRQQQEMMELSTPVVKLWEGILALPIIGTLDSARTQVIMENLLGAIVQTNSRVAIIDITGVPTVDTLVAQHLLKTVTAARLMGAECIISGVRPQIAQTIVHLGIDLGQIITKAKLSDAFALALQKSGRSVVRNSNGAAPVAAAKKIETPRGE